MRYINLCSAPNNKNTLLIEQLHFVDTSSPLPLNSFKTSLLEYPIEDIAIELAGKEFTKQLKEELNGQEIGAFKVELQDSHNTLTLTCAINSYSIPTTKAFQVNLWLAIDHLINSYDFDGILISKEPLLNENNLPNTNALKNYVASQKCYAKQSPEYYENLIKKISNSTLDSKAENSCSLAGYYNFSLTHNIPLLTCLHAKNRFVIDYWDSLPKSLQSKNLELPWPQYKEQAQRVLNPREYDILIKTIAMDAKRDLFLTCLGKPTKDNRVYHYDAPEYSFILGMELAYKHEQLYIINHKENKGYINSYAPGKKLHDTFKNHMLALSQYNGWEFEDTDFHQHMVFSKGFTQKLLETGIIEPALMQKPNTPVDTSKTLLYTIASRFFEFSSESDEESEEVQDQPGCAIV